MYHIASEVKPKSSTLGTKHQWEGRNRACGEFWTFVDDPQIRPSLGSIPISGLEILKYDRVVKQNSIQCKY